MKTYLPVSLLSVFLAVILGSCQPDLTSADLDQLYTTMSGSFSSEQQAEADSTYYPISLHMYPIWPESGERWLYVEQAMVSEQDKPYRQRVYKIEGIELNRFQSIVYTLENDSLFVG
ncbi:MAG: chromophore lyase CpcT/CpeT, partial [Bacteroidota bacterium]